MSHIKYSLLLGQLHFKEIPVEEILPLEMKLYKIFDYIRLHITVLFSGADERLGAHHFKP